MNALEKNHIELFETYPDVMTVQQVRQALGIGRTAVYRLLESHEIECFMIGNAYKIPKPVSLTLSERTAREEPRYDRELTREKQQILCRPEFQGQQRQAGSEMDFAEPSGERQQAEGGSHAQ